MFLVLLLSGLQKTLHSSLRVHAFDEGLQSWGTSGWNCILQLSQFSIKNTPPWTSSFCIFAKSELPGANYGSASHIYCSCLFVDCILSALIIWWGSPKSGHILFVSFSFVCPVPAQGEYSYISFLFCSAIGSQYSWLCSIAGNAEDIRLLRSLILNSICQEKYVGSHQLSTGGCRMHQQENQTKHEVKFIWKGKGLIYHPSAMFKLFVSTQ